MNENQQEENAPVGVTDAAVSAEPAPAPTPAPVIAESSQPSVEKKDKKERAFIVGQTTSLGVREKDLVSPSNGWEDLPPGPQSSSNIVQDFEYSTPVVELRERKDLDGNSEVMFFLPERSKEADERIRAFVSPNTLKNGRGADWNQSLVAAATHTAYLDNRFESTVRRDGSKYRQFLETEAGRLGFTIPKIAEANTPSYTGEKAVLRVRSIMGLGGILSIPLYHSGFWITLTTPQEGALIELNRRLQEEKIELGRETFGLVFSNEQSYINRFLLDFCLEHVYEYSVRVDSVQDLRSMIKIQDLNILFWGLACLIWPRGFDYIRSLTTKDGIENNTVVSAKISLGKLMWVDSASFEEKHRAHMLHKGRGKMTVDQVQDYQRTFIPSLAEGRRISLRDNLEMMISSTHVDNYIQDGERWISGIAQTVDATFTQAIPTPEDRNRLISTHARASKLRNHGAWVKSIIIDGVENTDRDDIANVLDVLSVDDESSALIEKEILKFIDDATRALIAIPETSGQETGLPRFPHLIPVDVINTFFTLLAQRVNIIRLR